MTETKAQLKVSLYLTLLKTPEDELSSGEVELMFLLAKDPDIQKVFDRAYFDRVYVDGN
jgi:hypothetical protein